jgi:hypothetical protein
MLLAMNASNVEGLVIALLQLFFGLALGSSGIHLLQRGSTVLGSIACFAALVLSIKCLTRSVLWIASFQNPKSSE